MMSSQITVRFKKLAPGAAVPRKARPGDAGFDLVSAEATTVPPGGRALVRTGLAVEIPDGYEGQVRPRSGLALNHGVTVLNAPGTIDAGYRGEIGVILANFGPAAFAVAPGDRIAQLVIAPVANVAAEAAAELSETERGKGGFGSTGA